MSSRPIAIIGSVDPRRTDYDPPIKNVDDAPAACRALGRALAEAGRPILVFGASPAFIEQPVVEGYVASGQAKEKSIRMVYPRERDPEIHGELAEQQTHPELFDPAIDSHPRWEVSYYQSLTGVEGVLMVGGGPATLILGLMALASRMPVVSLATFGGSAEEIWAMLPSRPWIDAADHQEMSRGTWRDDRARELVASFERQRHNLQRMAAEKEAAAEQQQRSRDRRSGRAILYGIGAALLTMLGLFGGPEAFGANAWLAVYAVCFVAIPVLAGMAGSMFYTLRKSSEHPPSVGEAQAHGFWAGLISAVLFFTSQVTTNQGISTLREAVAAGTGGLDLLLLFSLVVAFVAGLTYEAAFSRWEAGELTGPAAPGGS